MSYGHHPKWRQTIKESFDVIGRKGRSIFLSLCVMALGLFLTLTYFQPFQWRHHFNGGDDHSTFQGDATSPGTGVNIVGEKHVVYERYYDVTGSSINRTVNNFRVGKKRKTNIVQWDDPRLDILHMTRPQFDTRFRNPCWYETLSTSEPYDNNTFSTYSPSARRVLEKLTDHWEEVFDAAYESTEELPTVRRLRCLPYFLIIGQPKCGSTDLFWKVAKHPDIDTPPIKELHWWSRNRQGRRFNYTKIIPFDEYVDMFDRTGLRIEERLINITDKESSDEYRGTSNQIITGEASVSLFWDNNNWMNFPENGNQTEPQYIVPHYIRHLIPGVKLILILREPTERMYSDYLYFHSTHSTNKSAEEFHVLVQNAIEGFEECFQQTSIRSCAYNSALYNSLKLRLQVGLYSVFLADWLKLFSRDQFFVVRLEDYSQQPINNIKQIYRFFDLREITPEEEAALLEVPMSNVRKTSDRQLGGMFEETRTLLKKFYRPFNEQLAQMLHDDKYLWDDVT